MIQYTLYKIQYIFKNVRDTGYMLHDTVYNIQDTVYQYFRDTGVLHWFQDQRLLDPEVKNNSRIFSHTHLDKIYQVIILEYSPILI